MFFVGIPVEIFQEKPRSILDSYTNYYDQSFRAIGGSYPINLYSEFFWNFSFFSLFLVPFVGLLLERFFSLKFWGVLIGRQISILKLVLWCFIYEMCLVLFRGSGLDLFFVYVVFGCLTFILFIYLPYIFLRKVVFFRINL